MMDISEEELIFRTSDGILVDEQDEWIPKSNKSIFRLIRGIRIYDNTTEFSRDIYKYRNDYLKKMTADSKLFEPLTASTLTAQGQITGIIFNEETLFPKLGIPDGKIVMIGCNYGEIYNPEYKYRFQIEKKTSIRGRKPKQRNKSRRKMQGSGTLS
jgi:hypothetical protein